MEMSSIICGFCNRSEESEITGPLLKKNTVVAHENCLFYSSALYNKNTPDIDDLEGFEEQDVIQEIKRGKALKCYKCRKSGATVGCEVKKCKRSYHYPCAMADKAQNMEDLKKGIFKIYCELHHQSPQRETNSGKSTAERSTPIGNGDRAQGLDIPPKRKRRHTLYGPTKKVMRDSDSSDAGDPQRDDSEQAPLENDLEEDTCSVTNHIVNADKTSTYTHEVQPSTSANARSSYNENQDETDDDSDQDSQSLLLPLKIERVETVSSSPGISPCSSSAQPVSLGSQFWSKCHEAGCVESIFSTFSSSMINLSERILTKQASNEECDLCFKVLIASGVLLDIMTGKEQDLKEKLSSLEKEREALKMALSIVSSASETSALGESTVQ